MVERRKEGIIVQGFRFSQVSWQRSIWRKYCQLRKKETDQELAIKCISKQLLNRERKQYQVFIEKEILQRLSHVGVIKMFYSFTDQNNLYIAVELCPCGDFADYLTGNFHKLSIETVQFYAAEIVLIIEYLHNNGIAHRDLKPENLLVTKDNHLKVIDFGTALFFNNNLVPKELMDKIKAIREKHQEQIEQDEQQMDDTRTRQGTFVGSPQYVSPELLETNICGPEADLWSLGCIIYKMFANETPFNAQNEYLIFQKIKEGKYPIPEHMPDEAKSLIQNLLSLNPKQRLGSQPKGSKYDFNALKGHPFFKGIQWNTLFEQQAPHRHFTVHKTGGNGEDMEMFKLQQIRANDSDDDDVKDTSHHLKGWGGNDSNAPVIQGIVLKKVGWMYYKKRNMVLLQNPPRLLYFEPENGMKLGEIPLKSNYKITMNDKSSFIIDGVNKKEKIKKYYFKESQTPATLWVEKIKKAIESAN